MRGLLILIAMSDDAQIDDALEADVEDVGDEEAVAALPADAQDADDDQPGASWQEMYDNPWLLLSMLFFVTAALGIPFLWKSRTFSTVSKVLLTIVLLAYTALLFWLTWQVLLWSYNRVLEAA